MKRLYWVFFGVSLLIAAVASYVASSSPDGVERVSEDLGFSQNAATPQPAPMPDYQISSLGEHAGGALAGVLGVLAVLVLAFGLGWILKSRKVA